METIDYIHEEVYYKEVAQTKKPRDLPMAIWRLRKACDVIQSEFKGLRNGGADDVDSSPVQKA